MISRLRVALLATIAAAAMVIGVGAGYQWGRSSAGSPGWNAVDVGFTRDMVTHHLQAISMAGHVRDTSTDKRVAAVAYDIETSQTDELGQLTGWLAERDISPNTQTPMTWMPGHDHPTNGLMPGMATPAQMRTLLDANGGRAMDILFLQLMLRHHQGGIEMAKYASENASTQYVRDLAGRMYGVQSGEIINIEQLLRQLGGAPLSPPT